MADDAAPGAADDLPEDLDATAVRGVYTFPDVRRRRFGGWLLLAVAGFCLAAWTARRGDPILVNGGTLAAAIALLAIGAYHLATSWPLAVRDLDALVAAAGAVGFPVGPASAQLGWRGLLSRPTWRVLLYSGEDPPAHRAIVLVDGSTGAVLSYFVEDNPEDWSQDERRSPAP
jgi:hypothetical protein